MFRLLKPQSRFFYFLFFLTFQPINMAKGVKSPLYNIMLHYELITKFPKKLPTRETLIIKCLLYYVLYVE
jgi:hypothetical protein